MKRYLFLLLFFLYNGILSGYALSASAHTQEIQLTPSQKGFNDMTLNQNGNEWEITTTGRDPFLFLRTPESIDFNTQYILEFESFNASEMLPLVIFVGQELDNKHLVEGYVLPRTEGWSSNTYDISIIQKAPLPPFNSLRIRFGLSSGNTIRVRNFKIRKPTAQEKELATNREKRNQQDMELSNRLNNYLTRQYSSSISNISMGLNGDIKIKGSVNGTNPDIQELGIAEIPMWKDITALSAPETFIPIHSKNFQLSVKRKAEDHHDRLLSGWAIVKKNGTSYELLSPMHYVDEITPRANLEKAHPTSLKGMGGCPFNHPDMQELGIASVTFNILLDRILFTDNAPGRTKYEYAGKTWYVDENPESHLKAIDKDMRIAFKNNWMVSAILLIPVNKEGQQNSWLAKVSHPEAEYSAAFAMPNLSSKEGSEAYAATMNFLTERYSRKDHLYGRIHHWIIHNEINNAFYWTSAGRKTIGTYMNLYQKSMRTVYYLARQYDPNAKVFISLDHDWNRKGDPRTYPGRDLLQLLTSFSHTDGDFEWGIAFHPYPQDINNPRTWEDSDATYNYDTPYLTFKNIEVIDAWAKLPHVAYRGKIREVQLTEQGLNSPDYSKQSLEDQAAGLAYVWEKIKHLSSITAFQYHLWADAAEEGGLCLGLRKFSHFQEDPLGKKPAWYLYKAIETPEWHTWSDFALKHLGIRDWNEILYKGSILPVQKPIEQTIGQ